MVAEQKGLKTDSLCLDCLGGHQDSETNLYKIRPRENGVKVEDAESLPDSAINSQMPPPECHSQDSSGNLLSGSLRHLLMAGIILSISSLIPQNSIPGYFNPIELHKTIVNCVCLTKNRTLLPIRDSFKTKQIDKPVTIPF